MKVGDMLPLSYGGIELAHAVVVEIDWSKGTATLEVPGALVVAGINTNLTDETPAPEVDRALANTEVVQETKQPVEETTFAAAPEPTRSLREMDFDSSVIDRNPDD